jgi:Phosphotransferase enzyme family
VSADFAVDVAEAERWVRSRLPIVGDLLHVQTEPWATVFRAETDRGVVWFKACSVRQAFEVPLTAALAHRWPGVVTEVLAHDDDRRWLLMVDAGRPLRELGNPPERWLELLPRYAELQIGEIEHVVEHLASGVPDLRVERLTALYEELTRVQLPLDPTETSALAAFAPRFGELCERLADDGIGPSVQHDDLHMNNVHLRDGALRVLDWGDASIAHPFFSLFETFRFLIGRNGLDPDDPWFVRLRDAYLEPWGADPASFDLALEVGGFAHAIAWIHQRDALPEADRAGFDVGLDQILRLAMRRALGSS